MGTGWPDLASQLLLLMRPARKMRAKKLPKTSLLRQNKRPRSAKLWSPPKAPRKAEGSGVPFRKSLRDAGLLRRGHSTAVLAWQAQMDGLDDRCRNVRRDKDGLRWMS